MKGKHGPGQHKCLFGTQTVRLGEPGTFVWVWHSSRERSGWAVGELRGGRRSIPDAPPRPVAWGTRMGPVTAGQEGNGDATAAGWQRALSSGQGRPASQTTFGRGWRPPLASGPVVLRPGRSCCSSRCLISDHLPLPVRRPPAAGPRPTSTRVQAPTPGSGAGKPRGSEGTEGTAASMSARWAGPERPCALSRNPDLDRLLTVLGVSGGETSQDWGPGHLSGGSTLDRNLASASTAWALPGGPACGSGLSRDVRTGRACSPAAGQGQRGRGLLVVGRRGSEAWRPVRKLSPHFPLGRGWNGAILPGTGPLCCLPELADWALALASPGYAVCANSRLSCASVYPRIEGQGED